MKKKEKAAGYLKQALELWEDLYAKTKLNQFKGYIELVKGMTG